MAQLHRRAFIANVAAGVVGISAIGLSSLPLIADPIELAAEWDQSAFRKLLRGGSRVRQLYDVVSPKYEVLTHIRNSLNGLQFGFNISPKHIQIVAVFRGPAIVMDFDDYIWSKYNFGKLFGIKDPDTGKPATRNVFNANKSDAVESPSSTYNAISMSSLYQRGARFLCCHNTTETAVDYLLSRNRLKESRKSVYQDLISHTLPGVLIVPTAVAAIAVLQSEGHYGYIYAQ